MEILLQLFIYLIFIMIFLGGVRKHEELLSKDECYKRLNSMRGIMALEIIIGHVVRYENSILLPLGKFMLVGVAFFFFVSGWGLCKQYYEKSGYLETFLKTRVVYVCGCIIITLVITSIIDFISPIDTRYSIHSLEGAELILQLINSINWYMRELLLLYLVFYLVFKLVKKYRIVILTMIVVIIACTLHALGYIRCWYASIMAFPLGFVFYLYFSRIIAVLKSFKGVLIVCGLGLLGLSSLVIEENLFIPIFVANNSLSICVIILLCLFSLVFSVENRAKVFLNKYATELYLYQFPFLAIAESANWNYWYKMIFVVASDVIISMLVHPVIIRLKYFCNSKR